MYTALLIIHTGALLASVYFAGSALARWRWYRTELADMTDTFWDQMRPSFQAGMRNNLWLAGFNLVLIAFNGFYAYRSFTLL